MSWWDWGRKGEAVGLRGLVDPGGLVALWEGIGGSMGGSFLVWGVDSGRGKIAWLGWAGGVMCRNTTAPELWQVASGWALARPSVLL